MGKLEKDDHIEDSDLDDYLSDDADKHEYDDFSQENQDYPAFPSSHIGRIPKNGHGKQNKHDLNDFVEYNLGTTEDKSLTKEEESFEPTE